MFDFLKKKKIKEISLGAPVKGKTIPLKEVNDPTFREEMLGKGIAIQPQEGKIYAPADGKIGMVFGTLHAISLTTTEGVEVLIHVGLDTVKMEGDGFKAYVKGGDTIKKGDLLLEANLEKIQEAGYDSVTAMIICNTDDYANIDGIYEKEVHPGESILVMQQKDR